MRILLAVAHPDDEVIGAARLLMTVGPAVSLVQVTDGAPRRDLSDVRRAGCRTARTYAEVREQELDAALRTGRVDLAHRLTLGIPDQEGSHRLVDIVQALAHLIAREHPSIVITHAYEGGHPDHDATAFAVQVACERLSHERGPAPVRLEFASYHAAGNAMRAGEFLPDTTGDERAIELTPAEQAVKRRMLEQFATQRETLRSFGTTHERLRVAPRYDFTRPPHAGRLHYERYDWGIQGNGWRAAAATALETIRCG
jgi:LmbE family N-acetylglucosaminyl deacetylase